MKLVTHEINIFENRSRIDEDTVFSVQLTDKSSRILAEHPVCGIHFCIFFSIDSMEQFVRLSSLPYLQSFLVRFWCSFVQKYS